MQRSTQVFFRALQVMTQQNLIEVVFLFGYAIHFVDTSPCLFGGISPSVKKSSKEVKQLLEAANPRAFRRMPVREPRSVVKL